MDLESGGTMIQRRRRLRQEYGQPTIKFTLDGSLSSLGTAITMMTNAAREGR
jgi:hypothetical protein